MIKKKALRTEEHEKNMNAVKLCDDDLNAVVGGVVIANQNSSVLSGLLQKLSTGMKINSSADDPSGYQISERMRVQIRSLNQANYNAQNGNSLIDG